MNALALVLPEGQYNLADQRAAMDALYHARIALGISLGDMEAKSGVSVNSFYAWRSVQRSPQLANLVALAQTLGFEIVMINKAAPYPVYSLHNMSIAVRAIDEARRGAKLSTKELEARTSVASNSFYSWLKCHRDPTLTRFVSLAEPLGFRVVMRRTLPKLAKA
jgi:predicted xylose isomerase-like sugar epimerase